MFAWLKRIVAPVAAIALLGMVSAANAATVSYTTTGSFTPSGTDSLATVTFTPPGVTLPGSLQAGGGSNLDLGFQGATGSSLGLPLTNGTLGYFYLSGQNLNQALNGGDTFTLNIAQTAPGVGGNSSTASITGNISYSAVPNTDNGVLKLTFSPNPVPITAGGVTLDYAIHNVDVTINNANQPFTAIITLSADVTVLPLPATASMGFGLLGGLLLLAGLRRLTLRRASMA